MVEKIKENIMIIICQCVHEIVDKAVEFSLILNKTDFYFIFIPGENYEIITFLSGPGLGNRFTVNSFNIDLIPIDNDLLSMEREGSFRQIYVDNNLTSITDLADSFLKLELCFGKVKHKYIKGERAKLFNDLLTNKETETNLKTTDEILGMIVFDRNVDFLTPFTTNYTYEGLFDDHFGINRGNIIVEQSYFESKESKDKKESTRKKLLSLYNDASSFFKKIRCMNYLDANKYMNDLKEYFAKFADNNALTDLKGLQETIMTFNKFFEIYKNPLKINGKFMTKFINENHKEENMVYRAKESIFLSGSIPNNIKLFYDDYITDKKDLIRLLNLFIIETMTQGGVKDYNLLKRDILNVYGYQNIFLFRDLETIGLLKEKVTLKKLIETSYQQFISKLNLISADVDYKKNKVKDCSYIYQGYCPIILRLIELAISGRWSKFKDIISKLPGDTIFPEDESEMTRPSSSEKKVHTIFLVFLGGICYNEIEGVRFLNRNLKNIYDKNKDKNIGRVQLIIVTNEILNKKKIFSSLGQKFEQACSFKKLKIDIDKGKEKNKSEKK